MTVEQQFEEIHKPKGLTQQAAGGPQSFFSVWAKRLGHAFRDHADFFFMLVLLGLLTRYCLLIPLPNAMQKIDQLDTSWGVDLVAKAQQGIWLGRDAFFNYGPLFQRLLSWGPLKRGMSLSSFYIYLWIFNYWTIVLAIYVTGAFVLRRQPSWVRVFYLLLLSIFWIPINWILFDINLLLPLCCFAIFLRMLPASGMEFRGLCWRAATAATLIAVGFLISGDAGIYSAAAFVVIVGASLLYEHERASLAGTAKYVALTGAFFACWVFTINGMLGKFLDFRFWRATYEVVTHYRWFDAARMLPEMVPILGLATGLNLLIFSWQWVVQKRTPLVPARARTAWLAMLCFGILTLQTLVVASEHFHVAIGLFPWIALSSALLLGATEIKISGLRLPVSLSAILVIKGVFSGPYSLFASPALFQGQFAAAGEDTCPPGLYEFDGFFLETIDFCNLRTVLVFLAQHTTNFYSI